MPLLSARPFLIPPALPGFAGSPATAPVSGAPGSLGSAVDKFPGTSKYMLAVRTTTGTQNGVLVITAEVTGTSVAWASGWFQVVNVAQCGGNSCRVSITCLDATRAMVVWEEASNAIKAQVVEIHPTTNGVINNGSTVTLDSGTTLNYASSLLVDTDKAMVTWQNTTTGDPRNRSVICSISSVTITPGSVFSWSGAALDATFAASHTNRSSIALSTTKVLTSYSSSAGGSRAAVFTVTGTNLAVGTANNFDTWGQRWEYGLAKLDGSRGLHVFSDGNNSNRLTAVVLSVSGTTVTDGPQTVISANAVDSLGNTDLYLADTDKVVVTYIDDVTGKQTIQTLTISGTSVTAGTEYELSAIAMSQGRIFPISTSQAFFEYRSGNHHGVVIDF